MMQQPLPQTSYHHHGEKNHQQRRQTGTQDGCHTVYNPHLIDNPVEDVESNTDHHANQYSLTGST
jgi:hypothetical protein